MRVSLTESQFKIKVRCKLDTLGDDCYYFVKEAASIRGIADIIGWYKGKPFAWELKRSKKESEKDRDGHVLQKYNLERAKKAQGIGRFVYPENFDECWKELINEKAS